MTEDKFGTIFNTDEELMDNLLTQMEMDLGKGEFNQEIFWYLGKTFEDIKLMVRYLNGQVDVQINISDHNFALYTDELEAYKMKLKKALED